MWNEEKDSILLKNWGVISAAKIGLLIQKTKNAVIGRHDRLMRGIETRTNFKPKDMPPVKYKRPDEIYMSFGSPTTLEKATGCKFPIEGTKLFCNAEANSVYCERHRKICFYKG